MYEQLDLNSKWRLIETIGDAHIRMGDRFGDWYISQRVEKGGDGFLASLTGRGLSPSGAVDDHLRLLTAVKSPEFLVVDAGRESRRHYRWNGAGFELVPK